MMASLKRIAQRLRRRCDHDWVYMGAVHVTEEFGYAVFDECSKCKTVLVRTP